MSKEGQCIGVFIVLLVLTIKLQQLHSVTINHCLKSESYSLKCGNTTTVPRYVPEGIQKVSLYGIDLDQCRRGVFSNETWLDVIELYIDAEFGTDLLPEVFIGLDNLTFLKLRGSELDTLSNESFRGLQKLTKLDLSDNFLLDTAFLFNVLRDSVMLTMPHLTWLDLSRVQIYYLYPISLDVESFTALSKRDIEFLNFTGCTIGSFDFPNLYRVCKHLRHLVLNRATLIQPNMLGVTECPSLKTLELRNLNSVDFINFQLYFLTRYDHPPYALELFLKPVLAVENLHMSNVFQNELHINVNFNLIFYVLRLTFVDISFNNIKVFNGSVELNQVTRKSIKYLDFSNNLLEYISPSILGASTNTLTLNLSHNSLQIMAANYEDDFNDLFKNLTELRSIDLSHNKLMSLPRLTFLHNIMLKEICLSNNLLISLNLKLDHLINLQYLNLHDNDIKTLSPEIISQLENIWSRPRPSKTIDPATSNREMVNQPVMQFYNNPLKCNCDEDVLETLNWITFSGYMNDTPNLTCTLNGENIRMFPSALERTKDFCQSVKLRLYLSIGGGISIAVILILILTLVWLLKRARKRHVIKRFSRKIKDGEKLKYLIFLSFCNEDGDTVLQDIIPKMQKEASSALGCDRNLVCCGELDFKPGQSVCLEVMRCMEESAVVIFAISDTFCQKDWCKMEVKEAKDQRKPVILLFLEKVDPDRMTPYIRKLFRRYTRASWIRDENGGHPHPTWPELISSVIELGATFEADDNVEIDNQSVTSDCFMKDIAMIELER